MPDVAALGKSLDLPAKVRLVDTDARSASGSTITEEPKT